MNDERLREIRERVKAATPGPWGCFDYGSYTGYWNVDCNLPDVLTVATLGKSHSGYGKPGESEANARFIAAARQDVPDLLAALAESDALLARACHDSHQFDLGREAERREVAAFVERMIRLHDYEPGDISAKAMAGEIKAMHYQHVLDAILARGATARVPLHETEADNQRLRNVLRAIVEGSAGVREAREALEGT